METVSKGIITPEFLQGCVKVLTSVSKVALHSHFSYEILSKVIRSEANPQINLSNSALNLVVGITLMSGLNILISSDKMITLRKEIAENISQIGISFLCTMTHAINPLDRFRIHLEAKIAYSLGNNIIVNILKLNYDNIRFSYIAFHFMFAYARFKNYI